MLRHSFEANWGQKRPANKYEWKEHYERWKCSQLAFYKEIGGRAELQRGKVHYGLAVHKGDSVAEEVLYGA